MIKKGLIVLPSWAYLILHNKKPWEIRGTNTKIRGRIGIIAKSSGKIYGEVTLVNSFPLTRELFNNNYNKHLLNCNYEDLPDNYKYVWVFENPVIYERPLEYNHPRGARIWVNFSDRYN